MVRWRLRSCGFDERGLLLPPNQAKNACSGPELRAGVAQLVEHLICNQAVGGSNPFASSRFPGAAALKLVES